MKRILWSALLALAASLGMTPALATTYTPCAAYSLPTPGDPAVQNIWGQILNNDFSLVDNAQGAKLTLSVAGAANVVLSGQNGQSDQSRNRYFDFTGAITANIDVLWAQNRCGLFVVKNDTTGAYTLSVGVNGGSGSPAGTTVTIPQGEAAAVYMDGTNGILAATPHGIGAAASGANSDITSLSGLTTPLSTGQGGTGVATFPAGTMLANKSASSGAPTTASIPVLHAQAISSTGTFTIPSGVSSGTVFEFDVVGGGGGGGATTNAGSGAGGGGSGGACAVYLSGFTAGSTVTVNIGTGGAGASTVAADGSTGGSTTIVYAGVTVITAAGGSGGKGQSGTGNGAGGSAGACTAAVGASGLTLVGNIPIFSENGGSSAVAWTSTWAGGFGGSNAYGTGALGVVSSTTPATPNAGVMGGGGGGGATGNSTFGGGASGGAGYFVAKWTL